MMEAKLQQAANDLPEPNRDFLAVEAAYSRSPSRPIRRPKLRLALLVCLSALLVGCVAGPTVPEYHLYNGSLSLLFPRLAVDDIAHLLGTDPEWKSAKKEAESLGWSIPESLGGSPWYEVGKANLTTKESHYLTAMLFHTYTQYSVSYGYQMKTEITLEDGSPCTANWTDADVELHFGSMENEVWRRQFGFDENGIWVGYESINSTVPEVSYAMEYEGITLYIATYRYDNDFHGLMSSYGQYVHWVDDDYNTVFCLVSMDDTPDFVIACAKELIDRMH